MKIIVQFTLLFFFSIAQVNAQKDVFADVSLADLEESFHLKDSSASAAVKYHVGELYYQFIPNRGFIYVYEVKKRIKIYNKEGYDQATIKIPYYKGEKKSQSESIGKIKGTTYNLENGKIVTTSIKSKDVFEEELSDVVGQKVFTLPEIKDGTIIEYSFKEESPYITNLPTWYFQSSIPVDYSEYVTQIPDFFVFRSFQQGFEEIELTNDEKEETFAFTNNNNANFPAKTKITRAIARDLPKIVPENYIHNINNYLTTLKFELTATRKPGEYEYEFINLTWEDAVKQIMEYSGFGGELKKKRFLKDDIANFESFDGNQLELATEVFRYIQDKMTWNEKRGITATDKLSKTYEEGSGSVADINLTQTILMRELGIKAYPVLLSTRRNGIPIAPGLGKMNYVITAAFIDDTYYLFDASDKYSAPNLLNDEILNWKGIVVIDEENYDQIELQPQTLSATSNILVLDIEEDGSVKGQMRRQMTNYEALRNRRRFAKMSEENMIEYLENNYDGISVSEYSFDNLEETDKPLALSFSFEFESAIDEIGNQWYINPLLFLATTEHSLTQEERTYPIDFPYPRNSRTMITINLPDSYEVEWVPEKASVVLPENVGSYRYFAVGQDNQIKINVSGGINSTILPAQFFPYLKEFFDQIVSKETQQVIVKKV